jgi:serine/threonine protein kinase
MSEITCPNGHRWKLPAGQPAPGPGSSAPCPVCGIATELLSGAASTPPRSPGSATDPLPATPAAEAMPTVPGYEVLEEIGRGGMGIVYRARQVAANRILALKVIRKDRLTHPEAVRRFRREAQAAARLSHPNVVLVHDTDQSGDTHYLAMEYVEGITLQRLVEQHGYLPVAQACSYVRQVALALQEICEHALVHRDIKPANLMVTLSGGLVKVLDMGVARLYQLRDSQEDLFSTLTQDGAMIGTPDYIAPEQLEDAHGADIRADLYSLGCTFHFLLAGDVPFPGGNLFQKLDKQRWAMPTPVDQLRSEVPAGVAAVVRKLLAKRPEERYQKPAELVAALDHLAENGYFTLEPPAPTVRESRRLTGHTDSVWTVAIAAHGRLAVSGGKDRALRLWDMASGQHLRTCGDHAQEIRSVALSPDGRQAVTASGATLRLWDLDTGKELGRFTGHTATIRSVVFSRDGRRLLSGSEDRTVRLWDVASRREQRRFTGHAGDVTSVVFTPDCRRGLSGSRDQTLRLWDLQSGKELQSFGGNRGLILSVALSLDGTQALSGNYDTTLHLWDVATGRELRRFQGHKQMVAAVAFSPDGRRVVSASHDRTLRLWDVESARELCCCEGHSSWVTSVAFAPDGRHVLSGSADKTLRLWQLPG